MWWQHRDQDTPLVTQQFGEPYPLKEKLVESHVALTTDYFRSFGKSVPRARKASEVIGLQKSTPSELPTSSLLAWSPEPKTHLLLLNSERSYRH